MLEIGSNLILLGEHESRDYDERIAIRLRPLELLGPAIVFPAVHESTLVCLEHLAEIDLVGKNVLDLGTGSGILAIAAAKLGAAMVVATEVEPFALEAAKRNAALNEVEVVFFLADELDPIGQLDLVIANLGDISGLNPWQYVAPWGELIISLKEDDGALEALKSTVLSDGTWVFTHHA